MSRAEWTLDACVGVKVCGRWLRWGLYEVGPDWERPGHVSGTIGLGLVQVHVYSYRAPITSVEYAPGRHEDFRGALCHWRDWRLR